MIIAINGRIGSGKDTVGRLIQYLLWKKRVEAGGMMLHYTIKDFLSEDFPSDILSTWQIKKFADKLKDMVCVLLNCTMENLENREFKEQPLGEEWWKIVPSKEVFYHSHKYYEGVDYLQYKEDYEKNKNNFKIIKTTPRLLMQLLGTDCGRNIIHPNIWVNSLMSEYDSCFEDGKVKYWGEGNWIITDMRFPN